MARQRDLAQVASQSRHYARELLSLHLVFWRRFCMSRKSGRFSPTILLFQDTNGAHAGTGVRAAAIDAQRCFRIARARRSCPGKAGSLD